MTTANNEKKDGLSVYDVHHRYAFLNDRTKNNNGSEVINLLIQASKKKDYNCKKANYGIEMISKKRYEKRNDSLMVMINQMQAHHSNKKEDCKSAKTDNAAERFQKQKLESYSEFASRNTQQNRKVPIVEGKYQPW